MQIKLPTIENLNLKGKKVILRVDFNVPMWKESVLDTYRIDRTLKTLNFLKEAGAKVLIISHLDEKEGETLLPVIKYLIPKFPRISFLKDILSDESKVSIEKMKEGDFILFENIRRYHEEENNDGLFAKKIADLAEIYINEAFSVSHRNHASIVSVSKHLPSYVGFLFAEEVKELSSAFNPEHPFLFILGGAKLDTKYPLLKKFLKTADNIFVGGILANDFFKAKGYFMGDSLLSDFNADTEIVNDKKILLPYDVRTQYKVIKYNKKPSDISIGEKICDLGEKSAKLLKPISDESKYILWNGPMGFIEQGFKKGTLELAKILSSSKAKVIIGGGDTISVIRNEPFFNKFHFISTGGGAMLDFLANGTLPGIKAVLDSNKNLKERSWIRKIFG